VGGADLPVVLLAGVQVVVVGQSPGITQPLGLVGLEQTEVGTDLDLRLAVLDVSNPINSVDALSRSVTARSMPGSTPGGRVRASGRRPWWWSSSGRRFVASGGRPAGLFDGPLAGVLIGEIEFDTVDEMDAYRPPGDVVRREITGDPRLTCAALAGDDPARVAEALAAVNGD